MSRFETLNLPGGRLCTTETVLRECDGFTGSLSEFLSRIDSHLPTPEAKRSADILLSNGNLCVTVTRVETDVEMNARLSRSEDHRRSSTPA